MKADILPLLAFRHYLSSLYKLYADSRYADILRVLIHLKPETPPSSGPLLVGARLFLGAGLSFRTCQTPWRAFSQLRRLVSLLTSSTRKSFLGSG